MSKERKTILPSYLDHHLEIGNGLKTKLYDKRDDLIFPIVNLPFISKAIFQHHYRMMFTFHNWYVILKLVSSTVIFMTELSCWSKSYSNRATLFLGWSHRSPNSTVVITIWLTVTKYLYLKIFYVLRRCFFPLSLPRILPYLIVYMSSTAGVL